MISQMLDREQTSEARALLYAAVADVLERGPVSDSMETLRPVESIVSPDETVVDHDLLAAEHYSLFGRSVMPYASAFLEEDGRLGGTVSHRFAVFYDEADWVLAPNDSEPDHFATQFRFLAFLEQMNRKALRDDKPDVAHYASWLAVRFIEDFASVALPSFILAVSRTGNPFYSSVLETAWRVVSEQLRTGNDGVEQLSEVAPTPATIRAYLLEPAVSQMDQPETATLDIDLSNQRSSVRDIVAYLTNCRRSGIFLSQSDITALSRAYSLPRGFGSRSMTLANLIRTAASLGELESLIDSLVALMDAERAGIVRLTEDAPLPLTVVRNYYVKRLSQTEEMLREMVRLRNAESFSAD